MSKTWMPAQLQFTISYSSKTTAKLSPRKHYSGLLLLLLLRDHPMQAKKVLTQGLPFMKETSALCFIPHSNKCTARLFAIHKHRKKESFLLGYTPLNRMLSRPRGWGGIFQLTSKHIALGKRL